MPFMLNKDSPVGFRPVSKEYAVSCAYGTKGESWKKGYHPGVDFAVKNVPVSAYRDGTVKAVFNDQHWGLYVKIEHNWGFTYYCHLKDAFVGVGDKIKEGHPIAVSGNSGVNRKTGKSHPYHLHFEARLKDSSTDVEPLFYADSTTQV